MHRLCSTPCLQCTSSHKPPTNRSKSLTNVPPQCVQVYGHQRSQPQRLCVTQQCRQPAHLCTCRQCVVQHAAAGQVQCMQRTGSVGGAACCPARSQLSTTGGRLQRGAPGCQQRTPHQPAAAAYGRRDEAGSAALEYSFVYKQVIASDPGSRRRSLLIHIQQCRTQRDIKQGWSLCAAGV
jgi:hypothetical protein